MIAKVRRNISKLDEKLATVKNTNIKNFNTSIREQLAILSGMTEAHQMSDFEVAQYLFDAYKTCTDTEFLAYMKRLEDRHHDPDDNLTFLPAGLLTRADTFYENAIARDVWLKKTKDQEDIIAVKATLAELLRHIMLNHFFLTEAPLLVVSRNLKKHFPHQV